VAKNHSTFAAKWNMLASNAADCRYGRRSVSRSCRRRGRRQSLSDLFSAWWACHQNKPVAIRDQRRSRTRKDEDSRSGSRCASLGTPCQIGLDRVAQIGNARVKCCEPGEVLVGRLVMPLGPAEDQRLSADSKSADNAVEVRPIVPVRFSELET